MAPTRIPLSVTGDHRSQRWPGPTPHPNTICRSGRFLYTPNKSHHQPYQVTAIPRLYRPYSAPVYLGSHAPGGTSSPLSLPPPPGLSLDRDTENPDSLGTGHSPSFLISQSTHRLCKLPLLCHQDPGELTTICLCELTCVCLQEETVWFLHAGVGDPKRIS